MSTINYTPQQRRERLALQVANYATSKNLARHEVDNVVLAATNAFDKDLTPATCYEIGRKATDMLAGAHYIEVHAVLFA